MFQIVDAHYRNFLSCSLQKRYSNRPIIEFEIAAQEQMKVTELRLAKLFSAKGKASSTAFQHPTAAKKVEGTSSPSIKLYFLLGHNMSWL